MESLKNNPQFNFYKSLGIDNINAEILSLLPSVYAFWTKNAVENLLRKVLDSWLHDPTGQFYTKEPMKVDDVNLQNYYQVMAEQKREGKMVHKKEGLLIAFSNFGKLSLES